jgi:MYXO-CTERM domain-containing protein
VAETTAHDDNPRRSNVPTLAYILICLSRTGRSGLISIVRRAIDMRNSSKNKWWTPVRNTTWTPGIRRLIGGLVSALIVGQPAPAHGVCKLVMPTEDVTYPVLPAGDQPVMIRVWDHRQSMIVSPTFLQAGGTFGLIVPVPTRPLVRRAFDPNLFESARIAAGPLVTWITREVEDPSLGEQCGDPKFVSNEGQVSKTNSDSGGGGCLGGGGPEAPSGSGINYDYAIDIGNTFGSGWDAGRAQVDGARGDGQATTIEDVRRDADGSSDEWARDEQDVVDWEGGDVPKPGREDDVYRNGNPYPDVLEPDTAGANAPSPVTDHGILDNYEVALLDGGNASAVLDWLDHNGFAATPEVQEVVQQYVAIGWEFVAVKIVNIDLGQFVALRPLELVFDMPDGMPVIPARIGWTQGLATKMTVWTVGTRAYHIAGASTTSFAGKPVTGTGELWSEYLGPGSILTRFDYSKDAMPPLVETLEKRHAGFKAQETISKEQLVYVPVTSCSKGSNSGLSSGIGCGCRVGDSPQLPGGPGLLGLLLVGVAIRQRAVRRRSQ